MGEVDELQSLRKELNDIGEEELGGRRLGDEVVERAYASTDEAIEASGYIGRSADTSFADEISRSIDEALAQGDELDVLGSRPLTDTTITGPAVGRTFDEVLEAVDLSRMTDQERRLLEEAWDRYATKPRRRIHTRDAYIRFVYGKRSGQIPKSRRLAPDAKSIEARVAIEAGHVAEEVQGMLRQTPKNSRAYDISFSDPIRQMSVTKTVIPDFMPVGVRDASGYFRSARRASEALLIADSKYTWDAAKNIVLTDQIRAMIILARRNDVPFVFLLKEGASGVSSGVRKFAEAVGAEIQVVREGTGLVR